MTAARHSNPSVYFVMITGYAGIDSAVRAVREGAYDYLANPFALGQLGVVLRRIKNRMALEEENRELSRRVVGHESHELVLHRKKRENRAGQWSCSAVNQGSRLRFPRMRVISPTKQRRPCSCKRFEAPHRAATATPFNSIAQQVLPHDCLYPLRHVLVDGE
jgi:CheY-like chemotaxis protein